MERILSPKEILVNTLKKENINILKLVGYPEGLDYLNVLSNDIKKGKWKIVLEKYFFDKFPGRVLQEEKDFKLLGFKGEILPDAYLVRSKNLRLPCLDIYLDFSQIPFFGVDLSFTNILDKHEKDSLIVQLSKTANILKNYLSNYHYFVFNIKEDIEPYFEKAYKNYPFHIFNSFEDIYKLGKEYQKDFNIIVLDPNAEKTLSWKDIEKDKINIFILGGIIDKNQSLDGLTSEILPEYKHRKITYKGYAYAVPDRLNHIVYIVSRWLTDRDRDDSFEKYIKEIMPNKFLRYLIRRFYYKDKNFIDFLIKEYNLSYKDIDKLIKN